MKDKYYIAIRPTTKEDHSIHREGCPFMPLKDKRIFLGIFKTSHDAVEEGRNYFEKSQKCQFCCHDKNLIVGETPGTDWSYLDLVPVKLQIPVSIQASMLCCLS